MPKQVVSAFGPVYLTDQASGHLAKADSATSFFDVMMEMKPTY